MPGQKRAGAKQDHDAGLAAQETSFHAFTVCQAKKGDLHLRADHAKRSAGHLSAPLPSIGHMIATSGRSKSWHWSVSLGDKGARGNTQGHALRRPVGTDGVVPGGHPCPASSEQWWTVNANVKHESRKQQRTENAYASTQTNKCKKHQPIRSRANAQGRHAETS